MPATPPTAVSTIEETEKTPSPHSIGKAPPTLEPTAIPIQIKLFPFIYVYENVNPNQM